MPKSETKPKSETNVKKNYLPLLPMRDVVIFPHMVLHFDAGRDESVAAVERAMKGNKRVFCVTQRNAADEEPGVKDLYPVGTIAMVKQMIHVPGDIVRVLVEGVERATLTGIRRQSECLMAAVIPFEETACENADELLVHGRALRGAFESYAEGSGRLPKETADTLLNIDDPLEMTDIVSTNVLQKTSDRQEILQERNPILRMDRLTVLLMRETELAEAEKRIQARLKEQVDQNQKDYYLREQIKSIQTELGDKDATDVEELRERLKTTPLNDEARAKAEKELERLGYMAPGTPEVAISRTYIEWILDLPWGKATEDCLDLQHAREVLDRNHYGLEKVKERIIEYLAVLRMKKDMKGPILCFVGPPGVGKTSIVRAIAEATGRSFVQMSLGGVKDEAEIRGHRRTYLGAIPGRIISGLKQAGSINPVFLFDEIDKMSSDFRGDPASAMLEVLDAEQNFAFRDHYMELPFDLSRVMFITTANNVEDIPAPLLDRLEVIEVPSYTDLDKLQIAHRHLLPKQITAHGLAKTSLRVSDTILKKVIEGYTRESGVRDLEHHIAKIVRKAVVEMLDSGKRSVTVNEAKLTDYLGAVRYLHDEVETKNQVGVVNGLAYTTVGGVMLPVECAVMPGTGVLQLTGKLGDVMQESAKAALSWVRGQSAAWGLSATYFKEHDIHIHAPEGAVPKDGPSAGVTMTTALVSTLLSIPARGDVAMTGEVTLHGRVMPIGGLREKLMAAYRNDMKTVLIPRENLKDLEDVAPEIREKLEIVPVDEVPEVLERVLTAPVPRA